MREYRLEYGSGALSLALNPSRACGELQPVPVPEVADVDAAVRHSLRDPVGSPSLHELLEGKSTALILTVDHTRPSPAPLIEPMLHLCGDMGVRATICVAIGRHRQMTQDEIERHFPESVRRRAEIVHHDPFDDSIVRDLGVTRRGTPVLVNRIVFEHEVVIGAGTLEPSYLAGFSGGRKLIMPGIAHYTAIDANHFLLTQPDARIGRLHGNPVSDDAEEFARRVPFHFIAYTISGPDDEVVDVVSGDPFAAHEEACRRTAGIYRVEPAHGDIIASSPGGYPYDCDLVQGKKAIVPAAALVSDGGAIIILAECREGLGSEPTFLEWLQTKTPQQVVEDVRKRELFSLGAHGANILARPIVERGATVILVTRPEICSALEGTYIAAVPSVEEACAIAEEAAGGGDIVLLRKARRLIVAA